MKKLKQLLVSDAVLPWIYGIYAVVFLLYAIARVWNYVDYTANTDPVWLTKASPSARYIILVIPIACLVFFALATILVRAKSKSRDALSRAHCRYMLQTFWLIAVFWVIEIFLYWSPLALVTWVFAMPLRLACTGFYVLAFARSVWGLRQCLRGGYPTQRDLPLYKTRGVKWLLWCFPGLLLLNWLVTSGSWYVQDYFSGHGNTHQITIVTQRPAAESPYKLRLVYRMKNPGPGCLGFDPFQGVWDSPSAPSMWVRAPDLVTDHEQTFYYAQSDVLPGYCDWRLDHVQIIDGNQLAELEDNPLFRDVRHGQKAFFGVDIPAYRFYSGLFLNTTLPNGWQNVENKDKYGKIFSRTSLVSKTVIRHEFFVHPDDPRCLNSLDCE